MSYHFASKYISITMDEREGGREKERERKRNYPDKYIKIRRDGT